MCFYTEQSKPKIASEDIKGYKLLIKNQQGLFVSYFYQAHVTKFNKVLKNDHKLELIYGGWHGEYEVEEGIFHIFMDLDPIKICHFHKQLNDKPTEDIFVSEAIIPKGTKYFSGWSNAFSGGDTTYGATHIIYKTPIQIDEFLKSI